MSNRDRKKLDLATAKKSNRKKNPIKPIIEETQVKIVEETFKYETPDLSKKEDKVEQFVSGLDKEIIQESKTKVRPKINLFDKKKKTEVKPDFLDLDGDGDKTEPMVKSASEVEPKKKEVKEEVLETHSDRMLGVIDQQLSTMAKLNRNETPQPKNITEQKIENLEGQVRDMRRMVLEMSSVAQQNTIVGSLGAGSPGSGEVRFLNLDDVDKTTFDTDAEGQIIMWDKETQKFASIPLVSTTPDANDVSKELQGFYGMRSSYYYNGTASATEIDVTDVDTWIDVNFTTDPEGLYDNRTSAMKSASVVGHTGVGTQVDPITFLLDGLTSRSTLKLNASLGFQPESDEGQLEVRLNFTRNSSSALGNFFIPDIVANMDQGAGIEYEIEQSLSFFCDDTISTVVPGDAGQFTFQIRSTTAGTLSLRALTLFISQ